MPHGSITIQIDYTPMIRTDAEELRPLGRKDVFGRITLRLLSNVQHQIEAALS